MNPLEKELNDCFTMGDIGRAAELLEFTPAQLQEYFDQADVVLDQLERLIAEFPGTEHRLVPGARRALEELTRTALVDLGFQEPAA